MIKPPKKKVSLVARVERQVGQIERFEMDLFYVLPSFPQYDTYLFSVRLNIIFVAKSKFAKNQCARTTISQSKSFEDIDKRNL